MGIPGRTIRCTVCRLDLEPLEFRGIRGQICRLCEASRDVKKHGKALDAAKRRQTAIMADRHQRKAKAEAFEARMRAAAGDD